MNAPSEVRDIEKVRRYQKQKGSYNSVDCYSYNRRYYIHALSYNYNMNNANTTKRMQDKARLAQLCFQVQRTREAEIVGPENDECYIFKTTLGETVLYIAGTDSPEEWIHNFECYLNLGEFKGAVRTLCERFRKLPSPKTLVGYSRGAVIAIELANLVVCDVITVGDPGLRALTVGSSSYPSSIRATPSIAVQEKRAALGSAWPSSSRKRWRGTRRTSELYKMTPRNLVMIYCLSRLLDSVHKGVLFAVPQHVCLDRRILRAVLSNVRRASVMSGLTRTVVIVVDIGFISC